MRYRASSVSFIVLSWNMWCPDSITQGLALLLRIIRLFRFLSRMHRLPVGSSVPLKTYVTIVRLMLTQPQPLGRMVKLPVNLDCLMTVIDNAGFSPFGTPKPSANIVVDGTDTGAPMQCPARIQVPTKCAAGCAEEEVAPSEVTAYPLFSKVNKKRGHALA